MVFLERSNHNILHALLLLHFRQAEGLNITLDISSIYSNAIARITALHADRSEEDNQKLVHAYGGLKIALQLLHSLVSYKPSSDTTQTGFITRRKPETDTEYFEPHDLLVKIRSTILPFIQEIWRASWLISAPSGVAKYAIQIVLQLLRAENEESPAFTP
jgi:E3 ubiquitin-protein ligase HUWE1